MTGPLVEKVDFESWLDEGFNTQNDMLNSNGGFFTKCVSEDGDIKFTGPFGCFSFSASTDGALMAFYTTRLF